MALSLAASRRTLWCVSFFLLERRYGKVPDAVAASEAVPPRLPPRAGVPGPAASSGFVLLKTH